MSILVNLKDRAILRRRSDERPQAYIDWVNSCKNVCGNEHISEFRDWIRESDEEDFTITFYEA